MSQACFGFSTESTAVKISLVLHMLTPVILVFVFSKGSCPILTALAVLITAVTAVVRSVTHPAVGNAAMVPALKLRG